MKNKIIFIILCLVSIPISVEAASINVSTGSITSEPNSTKKFIVTCSGCEGSIVISSSNGNVASVSPTSPWIDGNGKEITVNIKSTGNATLTIKPSSIADITTNKDIENQLASRKINVSVVEKQTQSSSKPTTNNSSSKNSKNNNNSTKNESQSKKSDNNDLKKLEVEGFKLDKDFNKNSTEYSVNVSNETKKIKITAEKDSDKSKIIGDGEKEVKEGENKFEVIVTSESGKEKKYIVNVIVDSKPIKVTVDNKEYTIVKKKEDLPELNIEHDDLTLTIEDQEVPAYRIDKISYVLIGLRDNEGKINLFKFVSFKDSNEPYQYTLYNEIKFNQLSIVIKDFPKSKIPSNYKLYKETINDKEINVYKLSKNSNYSLIYGINIETGKENIYKYDKQENTIQTFEREEQEKLEKGTEQYKKLIIILVVVIIFLILLLTIALTKAFTKNKNKKANDELTKKDIKKIEKETKRMKKKNKEKEAEL